MCVHLAAPASRCHSLVHERRPTVQQKMQTVHSALMSGLLTGSSYSSGRILLYLRSHKTYESRCILACASCTCPASCLQNHKTNMSRGTEFPTRLLVRFSKDSDQLARIYRLIGVHAIRLKTLWVLAYPHSLRRFLSDCMGVAQAYLCIRWTHIQSCWKCCAPAYIIESLGQRHAKMCLRAYAECEGPGINLRVRTV